MDKGFLFDGVQKKKRKKPQFGYNPVAVWAEEAKKVWDSCPVLGQKESGHILTIAKACKGEAEFRHVVHEYFTSDHKFAAQTGYAPFVLIKLVHLFTGNYRKMMKEASGAKRDTILEKQKANELKSRNMAENYAAARSAIATLEAIAVETQQR